MRERRITVSVSFRKTRARDKSKAGVVYFRLSGPKSDGSRSVLSFNTDISGADSLVIERERDRILTYIRLICHVVERLGSDGTSPVVDAVVNAARALLKDEERCRKTLRTIDRDAPLRGDLVAVGSPFHNCFTYIFPDPAIEMTDDPDLLTFIAFKSRSSRSANKISTSRSYSYLQKELAQFSGSGLIPWDAVGQTFVKEFAVWLMDRGYKDTTQGYYLSMLRTILFQSREEGLCDATSEWFRSVNTSVVPKEQKAPEKRIDVGVLKKIAALDLEGDEDLAMVRDMFMFAFYSRGMELVDVAHLTAENIRDGILVYRKRQTGKEIRVPIEKEALNILNRYELTGRYIFPLLETGRSGLFATRRNWVNTQIKTIGNMAGYPGLTFVRNIDAWAALVSEMHITESIFNRSYL